MFHIKKITLDDLYPDLLSYFIRNQEIKRCWRKENDEWVLKEISYVENWDTDLLKEIVAVDLTNCLKSGAFVWGVFDGSDNMIAWATLLSNFFGSSNQYLELMQLHVSDECRRKGIGKNLFALCAQKARQLGAKKLYISAHPSEEAQLFYKSIGCVDAVEVNAKIAAYEPYDRQMEFVL